MYSQALAKIARQYRDYTVTANVNQIKAFKVTVSTKQLSTGKKY